MKTSVKNIILILIAMTLVLFDQFTKLIATKNLQGGKPFTIIKNILEFRYLEGGNKGAAWGMLSGQIAFFVVVSVLISIAIVLLIIRLNSLMSKGKISVKKYNLVELLLVALISGALGNMIDRIIHGYVIDFIYFRLIDFPIFNVADCYVTVSCAVLIVISVFFIKDEEISVIFSNNKKEQ
ncbi:MAG: signal peptidase II [Lachnospiraceae bacterium]|nr:signal peptidase II [Lachnospiraceae bacterium]